jgi:hypothetical protein
VVFSHWVFPSYAKGDSRMQGLEDCIQNYDIYSIQNQPELHAKRLRDESLERGEMVSHPIYVWKYEDE